jgi:hypothetical protein
MGHICYASFVPGLSGPHMILFPSFFLFPIPNDLHASERIVSDHTHLVKPLLHYILV